MASGTGALWDLSGQTPTKQSLPSGTRSDVGSQSGTTSSSDITGTFSSQSVIGTNTPQFAQDALAQLIAQLSGGPTISQADLDAKVPLLKPAWVSPATAGSSNGGWGFIDPLTGKQYRAGDPQISVINSQRNQQRQQLLNDSKGAPGTDYIQKQIKQRDALLSSLQSDKSGYTKEAAFSDAADLSSRFMRQLMEQLLPTINKAVDSSGTSGGAVRGLLAQDAAQRVAESQAALGLDTAAKYGQISSTLDNIINDLVKQGDPNVAALTQLLNVAKGTIDQHVASGGQTGFSDKSASTDQTTTQDVVQQGTKPTFGTSLPASGPASGVQIANSGGNVGGGYTVSVPGLHELTGGALTNEQLANLMNLSNPSGVSSRLSESGIGNG